MSVADQALLNATVTSSGSYLHENTTSHECVLFWNITGPVTGATPTIQFGLSEVDPSDRTTHIGQTVTSAVISTTGTDQLTIELAVSSLIMVTWTVTGDTPSFGGTNVAVVSRDAGVSVQVLPSPTGTQVATAANQDTAIANLQAINSLVPSTYDYISLGYTGSNLTTVVYKLGGSGGTTVSTLTLAYSGSTITSVTKT